MPGRGSIQILVYHTVKVLSNDQISMGDISNQGKDSFDKRGVISVWSIDI